VVSDQMTTQEYYADAQAELDVLAIAVFDEEVKELLGAITEAV